MLNSKHASFIVEYGRDINNLGFFILVLVLLGVKHVGSLHIAEQQLQTLGLLYTCGRGVVKT